MADEFPNRTTITETELLRLGEHWPGIREWAPRSTEWGTANATFFVGDHDAYLLKIYGDKNQAQLEFEHRVLLHLGRADLSFAIPVPQPSCSGAVLVPIAPDSASAQPPFQAAVYAVIPGASCARGDERRTFLQGAAMGELHQALRMAEIPREDAVLPAWGDLDRIHPLVPDWRTLPDALGMSAEVVEGTSRIIRRTEEMVPRLQAELPGQIVHADYVQPNILFDRDRISGVIDFEFATHDLRAFDVAASFYHFCLSPWSDTPRWTLIEAFLRGYASQVPFVPAEIDALPMLLRWQRLSCLVYWSGMYRQGLATRTSLVAAAEENLRLEGWIRHSGDALIDRTREWMRI